MNLVSWRPPERHPAGPLSQVLRGFAFGRHGPGEGAVPAGTWLSFSGSDVTGPDGVVSLGDDEQRLLALLIEQLGSALTPETIISSIWGPYFIHNRQKLFDCVAQLRRLLCIAGLTPTCIQELRDIGYRLLPSVEVLDESLALSA
ncbi:MAG TPA: helix-turn-helix domain-containing protein [Dehalococcoidia bacterium]|nr:helix-turn-helix domain-containing protein [Dehalococcoidia bacterium]